MAKRKSVPRRKRWSPTRISEPGDEGSAFDVVGGVAPYNDSLPSLIPFMWVESRDLVHDHFEVIAFGAYNMLGRIEPGEGGVAIVHEETANVLAVKTIPDKPDERNEEARRVITQIYSGKPEHLWQYFRNEGYDLRDE